MKYLFLILSLAGCCSLQQFPTPSPTESENCAPACQRLKALGCEEGEMLSDGTSCEQFCLDTLEAGHALNPSCILSICSCDQVTGCSK